MVEDPNQTSRNLDPETRNLNMEPQMTADQTRLELRAAMRE